MLSVKDVLTVLLIPFDGARSIQNVSRSVVHSKVPSIERHSNRKMKTRKKMIADVRGVPEGVPRVVRCGLLEAGEDFMRGGDK